MLSQRHREEGATRSTSDRISEIGESRVTLVRAVWCHVAGCRCLIGFPRNLSPRPTSFSLHRTIQTLKSARFERGCRRPNRMRHDRRFVDELDARSPAVLIQMVPTKDIQSPDAIALTEVGPLVESVRKVGVLQPVLVRRRPMGYELIAGARRFAAAKEAGLTELPCRVYNVGEQEVRALAEADGLRLRPEVEPHRRIPDPAAALGPTLTEISDSLRAAASCWGMSADGSDRPYGAAVRDIASIELQRATWLVEGLRMLTESTAMTPSRLMLGSLLDRALQLTDSERRLADVTLSLDLSPSAVTFRGDERLLLMAFGGIMQVVVAIARPAAPATIRCSVACENAVARVEVSQTQVDVPVELLARFFDHTYHDRPGGYGAAVNAAAAARVVELHAGRVSVERLEPTGCRVGVGLPL